MNAQKTLPITSATPFKITDADNSMLTALFNDKLPSVANLILDAEKAGEPLSRVAREIFTAFNDAAILLKKEGMLPYFSGNNPHNLDKGNQSSALSTAIAAVYGFTVPAANGINVYADKSPRSLAAMASMQPVADHLHSLGIIS